MNQNEKYEEEYNKMVESSIKRAEDKENSIVGKAKNLITDTYSEFKKGINVDPTPNKTYQVVQNMATRYAEKLQNTGFGLPTPQRGISSQGIAPQRGINRIAPQRGISSQGIAPQRGISSQGIAPQRGVAPRKFSFIGMTNRKFKSRLKL